MSATIEDLKEKLKLEDELDILTILQIESPELVEALSDHIIEKQDKLREYYGEADTELDR